MFKWQNIFVDEMNRARRTVALTLLTAAPGLAALAADPPNVVASIRPIHSLAAGVMGDVGTPALIVSGYGSPHVYQMRPSEARALARADIVLWVGEALETFMAGPIRNLSADARVVTLLEAGGLDLHPARKSNLWDSGHDHEDDGAAPDPHIWLAPGNAKAMVDAIARALAEVDPERSAVYAANGAATRARIDALTAGIEVRLAGVGSIPFVAMHDSMHYFESAFGVHAVGAITLDPDRQPGAGSVRALRQRMRAVGVVCYVTEPQFTSALVETLGSEGTLRRAIFDPIGPEGAVAADNYFAMMTANADNLARCLTGRNGAATAP